MPDDSLRTARLRGWLDPVLTGDLATQYELIRACQGRPECFPAVVKPLAVRGHHGRPGGRISQPFWVCERTVRRRGRAASAALTCTPVVLAPGVEAAE